ncbi:Na/Pi symporter [Sorangium sp. So ce590]|uniref:Na/Pi symporter n=1 Tax=Sorangium sp. So ce590 TaxID=3133317 RepID=UPI003F62F3E5
MPFNNSAPPWDDIVPAVLAGLALFLFGLRHLGQTLQEVAGERMKRSIAAVADNRLLGLLVGVVATTLLDSSSATTILVIRLVRAGQISFPGIPLIGLLSRLVEATSGDVGRQIANAHILFNTAGALLVLPFTPWIARVIERLIPGRSLRAEPGAPAALRRRDT